MERRQREGARFGARFRARLTAEELPNNGVVVQIAKSGSVNGGAIREGRGVAALNEERQHGEGLRRGEEWLCEGAPMRRLREGVATWRSGRARRTCGVVRWPCDAGVESLRGGVVAWRSGHARRTCDVVRWSCGVGVVRWSCGAGMVRCWCGAVWWLGTKREENAKRMKKARRRKGEMRGKTLLRKIRRTTSVKRGNRCNITANVLL